MVHSTHDEFDALLDRTATKAIEDKLTAEWEEFDDSLTDDDALLFVGTVPGSEEAFFRQAGKCLKQRLHTCATDGTPLPMERLLALRARTTTEALKERIRAIEDHLRGGPDEAADGADGAGGLFSSSRARYLVHPIQPRTMSEAMFSSLALTLVHSMGLSNPTAARAVLSAVTNELYRVPLGQGSSEVAVPSFRKVCEQAFQEQALGVEERRLALSAFVRCCILSERVSDILDCVRICEQFDLELDVGATASQLLQFSLREPLPDPDGSTLVGLWSVQWNLHPSTTAHALPFGPNHAFLAEGTFESAVAVLGNFLYIYDQFAGLARIGTGHGGTLRGFVYERNMSAPLELQDLDCSEQLSLFAAAGKLYVRIPRGRSFVVAAVDTESLAIGSPMEIAPLSSTDSCQCDEDEDDEDDIDELSGIKTCASGSTAVDIWCVAPFVSSEDESAQKSASGDETHKLIATVFDTSNELRRIARIPLRPDASNKDMEELYNAITSDFELASFYTNGSFLHAIIPYAADDEPSAAGFSGARYLVASWNLSTGSMLPPRDLGRAPVGLAMCFDPMRECLWSYLAGTAEIAAFAPKRQRSVTVTSDVVTRVPLRAICARVHEEHATRWRTREFNACVLSFLGDLATNVPARARVAPFCADASAPTVLKAVDLLLRIMDSCSADDRNEAPARDRPLERLLCIVGLLRVVHVSVRAGLPDSVQVAAAIAAVSQRWRAQRAELVAAARHTADAARLAHEATAAVVASLLHLVDDAAMLEAAMRDAAVSFGPAHVLSAYISLAKPAEDTLPTALALFLAAGGVEVGGGGGGDGSEAQHAAPAAVGTGVAAAAVVDDDGHEFLSVGAVCANMSETERTALAEALWCSSAEAAAQERERPSTGGRASAASEEGEAAVAAVATSFPAHTVLETLLARIWSCGSSMRATCVSLLLRAWLGSARLSEAALSCERARAPLARLLDGALDIAYEAVRDTSFARGAIVSLREVYARFRARDAASARARIASRGDAYAQRRYERVVESAHPYAEDASTKEVVAFPGALFLTAEFDADCDSGFNDTLDLYVHPEASGRFGPSLRGPRGAWPRRVIIPSDHAVFLFHAEAQPGEPPRFGFRCTVRAHFPRTRATPTTLPSLACARVARVAATLTRAANALLDSTAAAAARLERALPSHTWATRLVEAAPGGGDAGALLGGSQGAGGGAPGSRRQRRRSSTSAGVAATRAPRSFREEDHAVAEAARELESASAQRSRLRDSIDDDVIPAVLRARRTSRSSSPVRAVDRDGNVVLASAVSYLLGSPSRPSALLWWLELGVHAGSASASSSSGSAGTPLDGLAPAVGERAARAAASDSAGEAAAAPASRTERSIAEQAARCAAAAAVLQLCVRRVRAVVGDAGSAVETDGDAVDPADARAIKAALRATSVADVAAAAAACPALAGAREAASAATLHLVRAGQLAVAQGQTSDMTEHDAATAREEAVVRAARALVSRAEILCGSAPADPSTTPQPSAITALLVADIDIAVLRKVRRRRRQMRRDIAQAFDVLAFILERGSRATCELVLSTLARAVWDAEVGGPARQPAWARAIPEAQPIRWRVVSTIFSRYVDEGPASADAPEHALHFAALAVLCVGLPSAGDAEQLGELHLPERLAAFLASAVQPLETSLDEYRGRALAVRVAWYVLAALCLRIFRPLRQASSLAAAGPVGAADPAAPAAAPLAPLAAIRGGVEVASDVLTALSGLLVHSGREGEFVRPVSVLAVLHGTAGADTAMLRPLIPSLCHTMRTGDGPSQTLAFSLLRTVLPGTPPEHALRMPSLTGAAGAGPASQARPLVDVLFDLLGSAVFNTGGRGAVDNSVFAVARRPTIEPTAQRRTARSGSTASAASSADASNPLAAAAAAAVASVSATSEADQPLAFTDGLDELSLPLPRRLSNAFAVGPLRVSADGLEVENTLSRGASLVPGVACADIPIHSALPWHYFEATVLSGGDENSLAIGLWPANDLPAGFPGLEEGSYGYHGDDGHKYKWTYMNRGALYGPRYREGDTVGCALCPGEGVVYFTRNGESLGPAFRNVRGPMRPCVSVRSPGARLRLNFGQKEFKFSVARLRAETSARGSRRRDFRLGYHKVSVAAEAVALIRELMVSDSWSQRVQLRINDALRLLPQLGASERPSGADLHALAALCVIDGVSEERLRRGSHVEVRTDPSATRGFRATVIDLDPRAPRVRVAFDGAAPLVSDSVPSELVAPIPEVLPNPRSFALREDALAGVVAYLERRATQTLEDNLFHAIVQARAVKAMAVVAERPEARLARDALRRAVPLLRDLACRWNNGATELALHKLERVSIALQEALFERAHMVLRLRGDDALVRGNAADAAADAVDASADEGDEDASRVAALCRRYRVTDTELEQLRMQFDTFDTDRNGTISLADFSRLMLFSTGQFTREQYRQFIQMDRSRTHAVGFAEFVEYALRSRLEIPAEDFSSSSSGTERADGAQTAASSESDASAARFESEVRTAGGAVSLADVRVGGELAVSRRSASPTKDWEVAMDATVGLAGVVCKVDPAGYVFLRTYDPARSAFGEWWYPLKALRRLSPADTVDVSRRRVLHVEAALATLYARQAMAALLAYVPLSEDISLSDFGSHRDLALVLKNTVLQGVYRSAARACAGGTDPLLPLRTVLGTILRKQHVLQAFRRTPAALAERFVGRMLSQRGSLERARGTRATLRARLWVRHPGIRLDGGGDGSEHHRRQRHKHRANVDADNDDDAPFPRLQPLTLDEEDESGDEDSDGEVESADRPPELPERPKPRRVESDDSLQASRGLTPLQELSRRARSAHVLSPVPEDEKQSPLPSPSSTREDAQSASSDVQSASSDAPGARPAGGARGAPKRTGSMRSIATDERLDLGESVQAAGGSGDAEPARESDHDEAKGVDEDRAASEDARPDGRASAPSARVGERPASVQSADSARSATASTASASMPVRPTPRRTDSVVSFASSDTVFSSSTGFSSSERPASRWSSPRARSSSSGRWEQLEVALCNDELLFYPNEAALEAERWAYAPVSLRGASLDATRPAAAMRGRRGTGRVYPIAVTSATRQVGAAAVPLVLAFEDEADRQHWAGQLRSVLREDDASSSTSSTGSGESSENPPAGAKDGDGAGAEAAASAGDALRLRRASASGSVDIASLLYDGAVTNLRGSLAQRPLSRVIESVHPYGPADGFEAREIHVIGADGMVVHFDELCDTVVGQRNTDAVVISLDRRRRQTIARRFGRGLASWAPVEVPGDTLYVSFIVRQRVRQSSLFGFRLTVTPRRMQLSDALLRTPSLEYSLWIAEWVVTVNPLWVGRFFKRSILDALLELTLTEHLLVDTRIRILNVLARFTVDLSRFGAPPGDDLVDRIVRGVDAQFRRENRDSAGHCYSRFLQQFFDFAVCFLVARARALLGASSGPAGEGGSAEPARSASVSDDAVASALARESLRAAPDHAWLYDAALTVHALQVYAETGRFTRAIVRRAMELPMDRRGRVIESAHPISPERQNLAHDDRDAEALVLVFDPASGFASSSDFLELRDSFESANREPILRCTAMDFPRRPLVLESKILFVHYWYTSVEPDWGFRLTVYPDTAQGRRNRAASVKLAAREQVSWSRAADERLVACMDARMREIRGATMESPYASTEFAHVVVLDWEKTDLLAHDPVLGSIPVEHCVRRSMILKWLSVALVGMLPLIDLTRADDPVAIAGLYAKVDSIVMGAAKLEFFERVLRESEYHGDMAEIELNRLNMRKPLLQQSFDEIVRANPVPFRRNDRAFRVRFVGEGSVDDGGLYREALSILCREMRSADPPILLPSPNAISGIGEMAEKTVCNPSLSSPRDLAMYEMLGMFIGISLRTKNYLDIDLPSMVWKPLVGQEPTLSDLELIDSAGVNSIRQLTALDEEEFAAVAESCQLCFTAVLSDESEIPLVTNGAERQVLWRDRRLFAKLWEKARIQESRQQVEAIRRGVNRIVPSHMLHVFTWRELEVRVCGAPDVDIDELRRNTDVYGSTSSADDASFVDLFWRVLQSLENPQRAAFLRFVYGRSRLAEGGEGAERFELHLLRQSADSDSRLPVARTCLFQLHLPRYSCAAVMRERILYAITNCEDMDADFMPNARDMIARSSSSESLTEMENTTDSSCALQSILAICQKARYQAASAPRATPTLALAAARAAHATRKP